MKFLNEVYCRFLAALLALVTPSVVNRPCPETKEFVNTLVVAYRSGKQFRWKVYNTKDGDDIGTPWQEFYHWFFYEPSQSFIMKAPNQHLILVRKEIVNFEVTAQDE